MPLKEADLKDETEMEIILKNDPEQIEEGMKVIDNQVNMPNGRIDLLCTDREKVLTIVELKVLSDENQLKQSIIYYDWALENLDWIKSAYKVEIADEDPRIILIAHEYDDNTIILAKYWNEYISPITLYVYKCTLVENKKQIICFEVSLPRPTEIREKPKSIEDHLDYVVDKNVRKVFSKAIETIKDFDEQVEVSVKKSGIAFKREGRNFACIYPKRESLAIDWKSDDEEKKWQSKRGVKKMEQLSEIIDDDIKKAFTVVGGKFKLRKEVE